MEEQPEPISQSQLAWFAVLFYGAMAGLGLLVMWLGDVDIAQAVFGSDAHAEPPNVALHMLLGTGAGLAVVVLAWLLRDLEHMRHLKQLLGSMLGNPSTGTIAILAITSSVGEELLFRGALQPIIGFWPTAIIFGLLHGGHDPKLWSWAVFGVLAGIMLGGLASLTGNLLAPILAHLTVNYWNLHALGSASNGSARSDA